jgi:DNA repair exonuclease SbcCD ATPase subunit
MIIFRKLRYKNILSTGNYFTEIQLDQNNTTLIVGSNGSGKSTMLDALCFGLFGKAFRNINKPNLINSINAKDCVVEIEFDTGNKSYKIVRGLKPNIFEIYCDNALINQSAAVRDYQEYLEKFILKLNYKSFTQIVVLGSASFTPFMQLSASDRRAIIEDLLDIEIFSRMNGVLKEKYSILKDDYTNTKYEYDIKKEKIQYQIQFIDSLKKDTDEKIEAQKLEIANCEAQYAESNTKCNLLHTEISTLREKVADKDKIKNKLIKYDGIRTSLKKTLTKVETDLEFYHDNSDCPTCKQAIGDEFKTHITDERNKKKSEVETALDQLENEYKKLLEKTVEIKTLLVEIDEKNSLLTTEQSEMLVCQRQITTLKAEIDRLSGKHENVEAEEAKLKTLNDELKELEKTMKSISEEKLYFETAGTLLKDTGIKTKIVKQYIPVINKLVNKYLASLDFFVNFTLDESFKESIKSRHRDDFTYASFSEGEKQRIDMALMLTWRAVSKLKNSSNTNLLILDEIFDSSLDANGTEELMKILNMLEGANLFVISHKGDVLQDKFSHVIRFEKVNNFSRIAK